MEAYWSATGRKDQENEGKNPAQWEVLGVSRCVGEQWPGFLFGDDRIGGRNA